MTQSIQTRLEGTSNALMLSPSLHERTDDACLDMLTPVGSADEDVLWVVFTRSPDSCIQEWMSHADGRPANMRIVSVGDTTRSAAARPSSLDDSCDNVVETLSNPGDLTGLGIKVSEVIKEWRDTGNRTAVCFHSLTALLQYADVQTVYKFLHVITGRFETAGARAHFHLDPDAHDPQTVNTLKSLFDGIVELRDDEWTVRTR